MHLVTLSGTYYEMGYEYGKMSKARLSLPDADTKDRKYASKCKEHVLEHIPSILEEVQGIADSTDINFELLITYLLYIPSATTWFFHAQPLGCTIFAVSGDETVDGFPIYARNYDWEYEKQDQLALFQIQPEGKLKSIGFADHMSGRYGGVNEAGLAAGITIMPYYNRKLQPGVPAWIATRWIIDTFKTTREAVTFLETIPHCEGYQFVLADSEGAIAKVEVAPEQVNTIPATKFTVATNHFQSEKMSQYSCEITDEIAGTTFTRLEKVNHWFEANKGNIDLDAVKRVLSGHENGVCDHQEWGGTIWSWIALLGTGNVEICAGPPCTHEYESYRLR